jgi:beta-glucanase (GH16 family)
MPAFGPASLFLPLCRTDWRSLAVLTVAALRRSNYALALTLTVLAGSAAARDRTPELVWSEEFDTGAAPDPQTWTHDLGAGGWGNSELQTYTDRPANVRVENGFLVITARREDFDGAPFTSARLHTRDKLEFQYGTLVARIRVPDLADGLWPAFWALGSDFKEVGWPDCGEIDVMEMGHAEGIAAGTVNRRVGSAAHWESWDKHAMYGKFLDAPANLDDDFHIYRVDWTPDVIRTSVDGQLVWEMDIRSRSCVDCSEFHQPYFVILNLAVGGTYPQRPDAESITAPLPAEMWVDYVRIYDSGDTALSGSAAPQE